jgi:hypothetical protein
MRRPSRWWRQTAMACLLTIGLSGCLDISLATQHHPICSWSSQPPANAGTLCKETFRTLRALARADFKGNTAAIRQLVPNRTVAHRVIQYGVMQRRQNVRVLHVVPSIALDSVRPGYVGAGFYLLSESSSGRGSNPETLYLRVRHGRALVVADQPGQDW